MPVAALLRGTPSMFKLLVRRPARLTAPGCPAILGNIRNVHNHVNTPLTHDKTTPTTTNPVHRLSAYLFQQEPPPDPTRQGYLPALPMEKIAGFANELVKAADESLDAAARKFNVAGKIDDFRNTFHNIVSASGEIRGHMSELTRQGLTLERISAELGAIFSNIPEHLKKAFPSPDQVPSHEERQKMVAGALDEVERGLLDFARGRGMSEDRLESLRQSFNRLRPHVEKLVSITSDLTEQYPALSRTLIFSALAMLIQEWWILRPLLSVIGFGPYGPVKGTPAAWIQRVFWGAAVRGGAFAFLQGWFSRTSDRPQDQTEEP